MRGFPLLILVLLTAGCSCQRTPGDDRGDTAHDATDAAARATLPASTATEAPPAASASPSKPATLGAEQGAPETAVHRYLELLLSDRASADRMWTSGKPAPQPDDAALRAALTDAASLRILTRAAVPLDRETPHRALEIPVDLRMSKDGAPLRFQGWYRVRRTIEGNGWELSSASVHVNLP